MGLPGWQDRSRRPAPRGRARPLLGRGTGAAAPASSSPSRAVDHGPQSIVWALSPPSARAVPSRSTVWRILTRHGVIVAQPAEAARSRRPHRFCFHRPNECWQSDWTQWPLADGTVVAIAGTLDDHSRYLTGLRAGPGRGTAELVWAVMLTAIAECGIPAMSLTDNGLVYTGRLRQGYESRSRLTCAPWASSTINSTPYHPQTCGKIERFWQTLKKWLRARAAARHRRRAQRPARPLPRVLQPPPPAPGAPRPHPRRSVHRHPARPAPPTARCPHPCSSPSATPSTTRRQPRRPALRRQRRTAAGPATTATASATATTSPSSPAPPSSVNSPPTPPATIRPATTTPRSYRTPRTRPTR